LLQCRGDLAVAVLLQGGSLEPVETYGHFTSGSVGNITGKMGTRPAQAQALWTLATFIATGLSQGQTLQDVMEPLVAVFAY